MRELVGAVWAVFASGPCVTRTEFLQREGLAEAIIAGLDPNMGSRLGSSCCTSASRGIVPARRLSGALHRLRTE